MSWRSLDEENPLAHEKMRDVHAAITRFVEHFPT
jgi:hypothetical protein